MRSTKFLALLLAAAGPACSERPTSVSAVRHAEPVRAATTPATLFVTTPDAPFTRLELTADASRPLSASAPTIITVDSAQRRQAVTSFGGAFNEKGWEALTLLAPSDREAAVQALFDRDTGLGLSYCRLPIGASDYALERYTLDESPGDTRMQHFSIERDKQHLIPYVKAAQSVRPDLEFWASAWTPPTWMKSPPVFDGGAFKDDPASYRAYALYLARFVESYAEQGIPIRMVVPQNEPQELTHYPSCDWKPSQYVAFLRDHAGPLFKQRGLKTELFLGTINRHQWDLLSVLRDPGARPYIAGVALQWSGIAHAAGVHELRPELPIMQSETECGNNHWQPGFDPEKPGNDFDYGAHTWRRLHDFFKAGATSYMLWNMVLDEQGKNLDSQRPWPQNSPIVVDRPSKRVSYTPMFWAAKHFSRLIARGARLVMSRGYPDQIAFRNPDGTIVVELMNITDAPLPLSLVVDSRSRAVELPPRSFATVLLPSSVGL